jgi:flagellar assembly factor FliW
MPFVKTQNFGAIEYEENSTIDFPNGLPGFEERRRFAALTFADSEPVVFLQSLEDQSLCFLTLPVLAIDRQYRLEVSEEDLALLELKREQQPRIGEEVACLAVLTLQESGPTANLLAPIVINLGNLKAVQAIAPESGYSHQHVLMPAEALTCS